MTSSRAGVTTIQLAGALAVAHLGSVGHVAKHFFKMSTVQLHRRLYHAIICWITTVDTTDEQAFMSTRPYFLAFLPADYTLQIFPTSHLLSMTTAREDSLDQVWARTTVLIAG